MNGADGNNGRSRQAAFLPIQEGVDALKPGETLTVGLGEYVENVSRSGLGKVPSDTVIRAKIPRAAVVARCRGFAKTGVIGLRELDVATEKHAK